MQQILLLPGIERAVALDDGIGLRGRDAPILPTRVSLDRHDEVARAPIVQEEEALAQAPQRRSSELVSSRIALDDVVGETGTHAMQQQVGVERYRPLTQSLARGSPSR